MNQYIPEEIKEIIKDQKYDIDDIGRSGNTILLFPEMVLKIEDKNQVSDNAFNAMTALKDRLPVSKVLSRVIENDKSYTLTTRLHGRMSCDPYFLERPEILLPALSEALHMMWNLDTKNLQSLPILENEKACSSPVFSHGDFCMPNILIGDDNKISGLIDLGDAAVSSLWRDLSLIHWSLTKNSDGTFGEKVYDKIKPDDLFSAVGVPFDKEACDFWINQVPWMNELED